MKKIIFFVILFVIFMFILFFLFSSGILWFNNPSSKDYPVRGIDVSSYQGDIDWSILSKENIDFVFIKATEGSSFKDKNFPYNIQNALKTNLKVGAYHFFSFDSRGETQADNFISIVPKREEMLPPVIDLEFYGDKSKDPPTKEHTESILIPLLDKLEKYYGKKPIIYASKSTFDLYLKDKFKENPIWIRDILKTPKLSDGREWTFWQYSNRGKLKGYVGVEKFIDLNVFNGSYEEFNKMFDK